MINSGTGGLSTVFDILNVWMLQAAKHEKALTLSIVCTSSFITWLPTPDKNVHNGLTPTVLYSHQSWRRPREMYHRPLCSAASAATSTCASEPPSQSRGPSARTETSAASGPGRENPTYLRRETKTSSAITKKCLKWWGKSWMSWHLFKDTHSGHKTIQQEHYGGLKNVHTLVWPLLIFLWRSPEWATEAKQMCTAAFWDTITALTNNGSFIITANGARTCTLLGSC